MCPWWFPYGDHICPLEDLGLLQRGRLFCPGLTPIAAQLGDWLVWTDGRGRMGGGGGYRWSGWPYGPDDGGPYGPGWMMGHDYQQTRGGALAGQAITMYAANAATGNIHATAAALPPLI